MPLHRAALRPAPSAAAPGLRGDRALGALLLLTLALQALAWSQLEGYQLGDSVEYMERARAHAAGERQPAEGLVRSFGFSGLLVPFFWVVDVLGLEDPRGVVPAIRAFQMALGLALVLIVTRIGTRLGGRAAGLGAGFVLAVNPVFLQYSVSPISGIAAALCMALAVLAVLGPGARRGLAGGLALGAGLLMAYQTIPIALTLIALVLVRNRRTDARQSAGLLLGYGLGILGQIGLDEWVYGSWGVTLGNYLLENGGTRAALLLHRLGAEDLARRVYERATPIEVDGGAVGSLQPPFYYLLELQRLLVLPVAALTFLGLLLAARRPRWSTSMLALALFVNALVLSSKGAKSFRLWLPLLPLIAPLAGMGVALVLGGTGARARGVRRVALGAALVMALVLGVHTLREVNMRRHGVYWRAIAHVDARAAQQAARPGDPPAPRPRIASAYHWAVFLRESPQVDLVKLPAHLDRWKSLAPELRVQVLAALSQVDWLLLHRPILEQERGLFEAIARGFEVVAAFWSPETSPELGPVLVLRRGGADPDGRPLMRTAAGVDPEAWRAEQGLDRHLLSPMAFVEPGEDGGRRLVYLGWRFEPLPGSHLGWIEHHWWTDTGLAGDWIVVDRITDPTGRNAWQNDHAPAYGFVPTSSFVPGEIFVEGYVLLAGDEPFTERFAPLGGPWRRGDLIPAWMWMQLARFDEQGAKSEWMLPARRDGRTPIDLAQAEELEDDALRSAEGLLFAPDRLVRVGPFLLPVHPGFRWPDDGRPDPE